MSVARERAQIEIPISSSLLLQQLVNCVNTRRTCDVEMDVVHIVLVVFRRHLTMVDSFISRCDVLYDQTPLVRSLVVVDA